MNFLKNGEQRKRIFHQLSGFTEPTYFRYAGHFLQIPNFTLPPAPIHYQDEFFDRDFSRLRLGKRLEHFFRYLIGKSKRYEMKVSNYQIQNERNETLGELDFLIFDRTKKRYIHVELAGKIYLYDPDVPDAELGKWTGPDKRDSAVKKLIKLHEHQFAVFHRFIHSEAGSNTLREWNLSPGIPVVPEICMKVRAFVPDIHTGYRYVTPANIKGYYLRLAEFAKPRYRNAEFFIPDKQDWMVSPSLGEIWLSHREALDEIERKLRARRSPLVWMRHPDGTFQSFFVVWW